MLSNFKVWLMFIFTCDLWASVMLLYVQDRRYLKSVQSAVLEPDAYNERAFVRVKKHNIKVGLCSKGKVWYFGKCRLKKWKETDYYDDVLSKTDTSSHTVLKSTLKDNISSTTEDVSVIALQKNHIITTTEDTSHIVLKTTRDYSFPTTEATSYIVLKTTQEYKTFPTTKTTSYITSKTTDQPTPEYTNERKSKTTKITSTSKEDANTTLEYTKDTMLKTTKTEEDVQPMPENTKHVTSKTTDKEDLQPTPENIEDVTLKSTHFDFYESTTRSNGVVKKKLGPAVSVPGHNNGTLSTLYWLTLLFVLLIGICV